ncbi:MAG: ribonuclease P protein component [Candidatus Omnitrophica bacterium]|nr:ribonuclease P protein component [Candidatus Omnitrophota bacterium]
MYFSDLVAQDLFFNAPAFDLSMVPDESFPKTERLLKTKDFMRVYKEGAFFRKGPLGLYRLPNALKKNRIGISISSQNIRLATMRNRIKRLLREVYRRSKKDLTMGFDIVLVVKRNFSKSISYKDVERLFMELAKESNLLK